MTVVKPSNRWMKKGGSSLWLGLVLFVVMLACGVWGSFTERELNREAYKFEPPHPRFVRWLIWNPAHADSVCVQSLAYSGDCAADELHVVQSAPLPVASAGKRYQYAPRSNRTLTEWSASGSPNGLAVDASTGVLSGVPALKGVFDVALTARINADSIVTQHFRLFVDDRYLLMGANRAGSDVFAMLVRSARYMLLPGLIAVPLGVIGGVVIGAFAGFYGGAPRRWLGAAVSVLQSIPGLVLIIVAAAASDLSQPIVMIVVGIILLPEASLGMAERVEYFRRKDFVEAARELGMRDRHILWREIVWHNARDFVMNRIANGFVFAILMEVTLSYLGMVNDHSGSLGIMLRSGRNSLDPVDGSNNEAVAAIVGLALVIATFTALDRGIRAAWGRTS